MVQSEFVGRTLFQGQVNLLRIAILSNLRPHRLFHEFTQKIYSVLGLNVTTPHPHTNMTKLHHLKELVYNTVCKR